MHNIRLSLKLLQQPLKLHSYIGCYGDEVFRIRHTPPQPLNNRCEYCNKLVSNKNDTCTSCGAPY